MLFEQAGFTVFKAASEASALRLAREHSPVCALVDLCIPTEQDGLRLIVRLKQAHPQTQILVLTGKRVHGLRERPEWPWITSVITKGSSSARLLSAVRALQP